jgi:FMN phosphatase YigB (HAD superfamily)
LNFNHHLHPGFAAIIAQRSALSSCPSFSFSCRREKALTWLFLIIMDPVITAELRSCRALIFDLMGTCVDWHSSLRPLLPTVSPRAAAQDAPLEPLLMAWREGFFAEIHRMRAAGLPQEDIDVTHRRLLEALLQERKLYETDDWTEEKKAELVQGWHRQGGWPDSMAGLMRLREKFFV